MSLKDDLGYKKKHSASAVKKLNKQKTPAQPEAASAAAPKPAKSAVLPAAAAPAIPQKPAGQLPAEGANTTALRTASEDKAGADMVTPAAPAAVPEAREGHKEAREPPPVKGKKSFRPLLIVLSILLLTALGLLLVLAVLPAFQSKGNNWYDPNAVSGSLPGKTPAEIQTELNKNVEEGMFNISIASLIMFEDGASEGAARIENIKANRYNMSVTITLDDGEELVYESKGLAPGQYIENIRLSRELPAGKYSATALFTAYTQDNLQKVGQSAAKITIVIEK